jgi:HK97 family phage prohead protease
MPSVLKGARAEELRRRDEGRLFFKDYRPADTALKAEETGEQRKIMGYAATWDLDQVGDRINPGAFKRSINSRGPRSGGTSDIKVMLNHQHVVGLPTDMYEDEKGLYVEGSIIDSFWGNECWSLVKNRVLDKMSIGFKLVRWEYVAGEGDEVYRDIYEVKLYECSIVAFPANEMASITGFKSFLEYPLFEEYLEELLTRKWNRVSAEEKTDLLGSLEDLAGRILKKFGEESVGEAERKRLRDILEPMRALLEPQDSPEEVADPGIHSALESMERLRKSFRLLA